MKQGLQHKIEKDIWLFYWSNGFEEFMISRNKNNYSLLDNWRFNEDEYDLFEDMVERIAPIKSMNWENYL